MERTSESSKSHREKSPERSLERKSDKRSRDDHHYDHRYSRDKRRNYDERNRHEHSRSRDSKYHSRSWSRRSSKDRDKRKERYRREEKEPSPVPLGPKAEVQETVTQQDQPPTAPAAYYQDQQQAAAAWGYYGWTDYSATYEYTAEQYQQYQQYYQSQDPSQYYAYYDPAYYQQQQQQQQQLPHPYQQIQPQQQQEIPPPPPPPPSNALEGASRDTEIPPPPPPLPPPLQTAPSTEDMDIDVAKTYNGVLSERALYDVGYPFQSSEDPSILFEKIGQVGEGTYGKVYKAKNGVTGQLMALKRIRMKTEKDGFPITAMREIKLLQKLRHERIVQLQQIMVSKGSVYMVLEYMDHDLSGILGHPNFRFEPAHSKSLVKQMLEGLAYLHHMGILHRDIKGSNLLINNKGELKIADFGLARLFEKNRAHDYTNRVITLWYRPPELLLGATAYGPAVDIWSVGCIMLEFFTGKAVFSGIDEISQLDSIYKTMGTPTIETWPTVTELPWYDLVRPTEIYTSKFRDTFETLLSPGALELSEALLSMDPSKRPTAAEALQFDYFKSESPEPIMPANLLDIAGDWHEFESKQRKRQKGTVNKPKQKVTPGRTQ